MATKKKHKIFSLKEAEALIPDLEKKIKHLQNKKETYSRVHDALFMHELVCAAERSNGFLSGKDDLENAIHALEDAIEQLAKDVEAIISSGCLLRNIDKGHVEFLGHHNGETVYFFWELGEPRIQHYRSVKSKLNDRRPLLKSDTKKKS